MSGDPYSDLTRELFAAPVHAAPQAGEPADGASVYVDGQGVRLRLNAVAKDGVLLGITFRALGCPHFIAACEWMCRATEGQPIETLCGWQPAEIMRTLALPVEKTGRILVLEDAARELAACLSASSPS